MVRANQFVCGKGRGALLALPAFFFFAAFAAPNAVAEDLEAKSKRAGALMSVGRFEEAIPICKELVAAMPGNTGLLLNLGLAEHMAGHEKEAVPVFENVLKSQPRSVPALISLGAARLSLGQPGLAVSPLQRAVGIEPANADARGMLADALNAVGKPDEAAVQYRKLTELAPSDPRAWYGLGMSYQVMAASAFDRLQSQDAASPYIAALIADTRVQRKQYRSAFYFYSEALKKLPGAHGLHAAMAEVYRKTGHPDWASTEEAKERTLAAADCAKHPAECQFVAGHDLQAVVLPPTPGPEALYWRAKAANELALQALIRLGQLPNSVELHQVKAQVARDQGQHLEAAKEWREALALAPENPRLQQELAVSYFLAADYKAAIAEAGKVLNVSPRSPELNFTIGDSWLRLEDPEKAIPFLRTALASDPKMLAAAASLGLSLSRTGKFAEAVPFLEKALDLDDDGSLHYQLARAYQSAGNAAKAQSAMARYEELQAKNKKDKEDAAAETRIVAPQ